jgi:hypothetical protein
VRECMRPILSPPMPRPNTRSRRSRPRLL